MAFIILFPINVFVYAYDILEAKQRGLFKKPVFGGWTCIDFLDNYGVDKKR